MNPNYPVISRKITEFWTKNSNIHTGTSKDWLVISMFGNIGVGEYAIYKAVAAAAPVIAASPNVPPTYCK